VNNELKAIHTMLEALLRSGNHIHWIGGYVYGRTSQDDPFVILYPASEHLNEKAVRVYEHDFGKLPPFIDTCNVPADTDNNPNKTQAQRKGIYHTCPLFKVCTYDGKDTQMGPEKRFGGVLYVTDKLPSGATAVSTPPPTVTTQPSPAELADSFFRVNDKVEVKGSTGNKPGVVTGFSDDRSLVAVKVEGTIYRLAPDKLIPMALA